MGGPAKNAEELVSEIQELCKLAEDAGKGDTRSKTVEEQLLSQIENLKRTNKELSKNSNLLQSILRSMPSGVTIQDLDYTITYQNDVLMNIYGDRTGEKCYRIFEGNDQVCEGCPVELAFRDGRSHTSVREVVSPSGEIAYWENTASPVRDASGKIVSCLEICTNITERKRAEQALRESESELKAIYENAPLVMLLVDRERRVIKMNAPALSMACRSMEESVGLRAGEALRCVHAFDDPKGCGFGPACEDCGIRNTVFRAFESGKALHRVEASIPYDHPDGPVDMHILVSATPLTELKEDIVLVCLEDITERKRAEKALRDSEMKSHALLEGSPVCNKIIDLDSRLLYMSSAGLKQLKIPDIKPYYGTIYPPQFYPESMRAPLIEHLERAKAGEISSVEAAVHDMEGNEVWYHTTFVPARDDEGRIEFIIASSVNITERKQAEKKLEQHRAELAHAWRVSTMGEMASGLAHELNQPLCAIMNYAGASLRTIKGRTGESGELAKTLEEIVSQADRAGQIIRRLRKLVAKGKPRQSTVSINDLVEEVLEMENAEARDKSITIHKDFADNLPSVIADPIQIEQVVLNIVRNAFDAMDDVPPDKRRITIRTSVAQDNSIELAVSDTGVGLSSEVEQKLFEPFFTSKAKGLGVGLSLSLSIIEAHGGKLWAQPNTDAGATFRFTLPLNRQKKDNPDNHIPAEA